MTANADRRARLADHALSLIRREIRAMPGYTPGEQQPGAIKLNTNECAYPPSPRVMETLGRIADNSLRLYPDPVSRHLREAAAARYDVSPDQVLAGNGSDDCLTILYRAFLAPGDRVICPWPTYGLYDTLATLQGAAITTTAFAVSEDERRWLLPAALAVDPAKLILIANPNNPSATLIPVDELRRLADQTTGIVVVDEAYVDFADSPASILPFLDQHPNVIVLRTFSKSFSLAGARLGLLFAAPALIAQLMKVKDSYNVNVLTQALGAVALEDRAYHDEVVRKTLAERARLESALGGLGLRWPESQANFLLCDVGDEAEAVYRALKREGILVRWWDSPELSTRLRITVGKPEENDRLIAALSSLLGAAVS
ncbi:MAG TPA: histidinol-phosphate transaminase [Polyangia bacterium]|jgi:histidinol-phosphate aminotransferase|nr:histidinol-phosphate transaminase [Polyangia bacterium]